MKSFFRLLLLIAICFIAKTNTMHAQCSPDVTAPVAICDQFTNVSVDLSCSATIPAQVFDDGSYDNCTTNIDFRVENAATPSATPPASTSITYTALGTYNTILWVGDSAGNWNQCMVTVSVEDKLDPVAICETQVDMTITGPTVVPASAFDDGSFDNCAVNLFYEFASTPSSTAPTNSSYTIDTLYNGVNDVILWVGDNGNPTNWSTCATTLVVNGTGCQNPSLICNNLTNVSLDANGMASVVPDMILQGAYCQTNWTYLIGLGPNAPTPFVSLDTSDIGQQAVVVYSFEGSDTVATSTCWGGIDVSNPLGGCTGDTIAPVAICETNLNVTIGANGTATVFASDLDDGSYDNCSSNLQFRIEELSTAGTTPPLATQITLPDTGQYNLVLWIIDTEGNFNSCITQVDVSNCLNSNLSCNDHIQVALDANNQAVLYEDAFLEGGPYCQSPWTYTIELNPGTTPNGSNPLVLDASSIGDSIIYQVYSYPPGSSTHIASCWGHVSIQASFTPVGCLGDVIAPVVLAPADTTVLESVLNSLDINNEALMNATFGSPYATDNCGIYDITTTLTVFDNQCDGITILRKFTAIDSAFNTATAVQTITTTRDPFEMHLPQNFAPGDTFLDSLTISSQPLHISYVSNDVIFDYDCDGSPDKILRTWTVIDWCDYGGILPAVELAQLDWDGDGIFGDAYDVVGDGTNLTTVQGNPPFVVGAQTGLYEYSQKIRYNDLDIYSHTVTGTVFHDANDNCTNDAENPLANWKVIGIGSPSGAGRSAITDANGNYSFEVCLGDTSVDVSLDVPYNYGGATCPTTYTVNFTGGVMSNETQTQDIGAQLEDQCPLMLIDMASPKVRPCFAGFYTVAYANISDQTITAPYVEVDLDQDLNFVSSTITETALGSNLYRFDLNDLMPGESGQFNINFFTDCATTPGMTHCSEAHIYPDTICPQSPLWSGANIEVAGTCVSDSVYFTITNTGYGNSQQLDFVVVEDVIMRQSQPFTLSSGQTFDVNPFKANGATFRLEADQEPGHPYGGMPSAVVEGCDGFTQGMVTLFPTGNSNPFIANVCQENVSSFDPNDKLANPVGYGSEHFIEPNTDIEYTIRFQNTGTDTAFNIVIMDTLSQNVDVTKVRALAASHPYRFERINGNVLRFSFDNVMLPDSNVNEPLSNGFVKFRIAQMPDLQDYTLIENNAAIYFDFNEPIITNTAFHTVKEDFLTVSSVKTHGIAKNLDVYPNPATDFIYFDGDVTVNGQQRFVLTDMQGKTVRTATIGAWPYRFERKGLSEGVYFFQIQNETQGMLYTGKVLLK